MSDLSNEDARSLVESVTWTHGFELSEGIVTPGAPTDARAILDARGLPADLSGLRALDIGALDGPYSFELERRGADVTALDIQDPDRTGFNIAKKILGSRVKYIQGNVYELSRILEDKYDVILYFGVWYHLKNPLLAFEQIHAVMNPGALLLSEGECLLSYAEGVDGAPIEDAEAVRQLAESPLPISLIYGNGYKQDRFNWFVPNKACVLEWHKAIALDVVGYGFWHDHPHQRMWVSSRRAGEVRVDNPVW